MGKNGKQNRNYPCFIVIVNRWHYVDHYQECGLVDKNAQKALPFSRFFIFFFNCIAAAYRKSKWRQKVKRKVTWLGLGFLFAAAMLLASCGSSNTAPPTSTSNTGNKYTSTTSTANETILTLTYGNIVKTLTLANVESLQGMQDMGGQKSPSGVITGPYIYQGAALTDFLKTVEPDGITAGQSVTVTGAGGQSVTFTYDQITNGGFTTYDSSGNVVTPAASIATKPIIGIAYMVNGNMLSNGSPGPLELGILYGQQLFTDSSEWVTMVDQITITGP